LAPADLLWLYRSSNGKLAPPSRVKGKGTNGRQAMHKSILAVATLMLGGLAAGGCGEPAPTAYTYTSEQEGFSLTFPSDWTKSTGGYGMNLEIQPPGQDDPNVFRDDIFVRVETLPATMPVEDYCAVKIAKGVKKMPDYKEINKSATKLCGQDAWRLTYSYRNPNFDTPVTSVTYFLTSGMRGYVIAANAGSDKFAERKAKFEEILWTFKLLGEAAPAPAVPAAPAAAPAATQ
jgi:hypothetical protein